MMAGWGALNAAIPVCWSTWLAQEISDEPESGGGLMVAAIQLAIMLGGAAAGAARKIRDTMLEIAAHNLGCSIEAAVYENGDVSVRGQPDKRLTWDEITAIAHRKFHQMPPGVEPVRAPRGVAEDFWAPVFM